MNQCPKILATIIILALSIPILGVFAVSDQIQTNLNVICDGDGVCEGAYGENQINCLTDCACSNNGICEAAQGETSKNCPLDCPVIETGGALFLPDAAPPVIYNLLISETTLNSAKILWETNEYTFCQLFWGKTQEYELETIVEAALYRQHQIKLTDLLPDTAYYFKISCRDSAKNESETTGQKFSTLVRPDIVPPANVLNFEAIAGDGKIELKWQNPPDLDFKAVKIMRSTEFYPSDSLTGTHVFNDKGTSFIDTGLTNGVRYYYTAFAYDFAGNYSSGAIVSSVPYKPGVIPPVVPLPPEVIPPVVPPPPEIEKITFNEFDFIQEGGKIPLEEGIKIKAKTKEPLTISIDYEKVPEVLKTIMVTLEKDKKSFSFLLRVNKEKTAYLSIIMPPEEAGIYPLTFTILDYKNKALKKIPGQLIVEKTETQTLPIPWHGEYQLYIYILAAMLILAVAIYIFRKFKI